MAQTSPVNTPTPETVDGYNAIAALANAKAAALDAEAKRIASQNALTKAQAGQNPIEAQLAAATQAANVAAQQRILSDSQSAILKNQFTIPDSGYTGDIKAGGKAGNIEASLLAACAINTAADQIAEKVEKLVTDKTVLLFPISDLPDFQALVSWNAQSLMIKSTLDESIKNLDDKGAAADKILDVVHTEAGPAALVGAAFDAVNKLLGFFRTDYSVEGVTLTSDDSILINGLASSLIKSSANVYLPSLYNAESVLKPSSIVIDLQNLAFKRIALQGRVDLQIPKVEALIRSTSQSEDQKSTKSQAASDLKSAIEQAKATIMLYDGFLSKITTPDDKFKVPLSTIIQQSAIAGNLSNGAFLMVVKISSSGGAYYTRKNLWSFLGTMPFFAMGGAVVNYTLIVGSTGRVLSAGAVPIDGGFVKVHRLPKIIEQLNTPPRQKAAKK